MTSGSLRRATYGALSSACLTWLSVSVAGQPKAPPLPDEAFGPGVVAVAAFDIRAVESESFRIALDQSMGESLARYRGFFDELLEVREEIDAARGVAVVWRFVHPEDKLLFSSARPAIAVGPESDEEALRALLAEREELDPIRMGDWLLSGVHPDPLQVRLNPQRVTMFREALEWGAGRPFVLVAVPPQDSEDPPIDVVADTGDIFTIEMDRAQWVAVWIHPGPPIDAGAAVKARNIEGAERLKAAYDEMKAAYEATREQFPVTNDRARLTELFFRATRVSQEGPFVFVSIDPSRTTEIALLVAPAVGEARQNAKRMQLMVNMRVACQALHLHMMEHGDWPKSLDELVANGYLDDLSDLQRHPLTGATTAFIYQRPDRLFRDMEDPSSVGVLFEVANGEIKPGGAVAYADGHVGYSDPPKEDP
ncbi:MAG: hypothetical protein ACF8PN_01070 [Phycisphaerales bacterium]